MVLQIITNTLLVIFIIITLILFDKLNKNNGKIDNLQNRISKLEFDRTELYNPHEIRDIIEEIEKSLNKYNKINIHPRLFNHLINNHKNEIQNIYITVDEEYITINYGTKQILLNKGTKDMDCQLMVDKGVIKY